MEAGHTPQVQQPAPPPLCPLFSAEPFGSLPIHARLFQKPLQEILGFCVLPYVNRVVPKNQTSAKTLAPAALSRKSKGDASLNPSRPLETRLENQGTIMKNPETKSFHHLSHTVAIIGLVGSLTLPVAVIADEVPPGCSFRSGGQGSAHWRGINFTQAQAHIGDRATVVPSFSMVSGACRATNVTGTIFIATGALTNFLDHATVNPGIAISGNYDFVITSDLVGAGVSSPDGSISGVPKTVRAMENIHGMAQTGESPEELGEGFHSASITIVTPALQVSLQPAYPLGQPCFPRGANVQCTGYVTNTGDIALTNVTVIDTRTAAPLQLLNPENGQPLTANAILSPGEYAMFASSFMPTPIENSGGSAASQITVTARDTTVIGGPTSRVTNSTSTTSIISPAAILTDATVLTDRKFSFNVIGQADVKYVVQATADLNAAVWVSLATNTASFNFVDEKAAQFPRRFYRVVPLP